ncbi:hypothetical protein CFG42_04250 [Salmonella enterica]|nr:hypothetical protein [Salmonella enterica]
MTTQVRKNVMDMFIDGARRGFTINKHDTQPTTQKGTPHAPTQNPPGVADAGRDDPGPNSVQC